MKSSASRFRVIPTALLAAAAIGLTGCAHRVVHVDREIEVHANPHPIVHHDVHVDRDVHVHRAPVPPRVRHHYRHHH